ncbi:hypothetical protein Tco_0782555 [Tanacetum coccineum]
MGGRRYYTNDCVELKRQLVPALESEKLNHLVKDIRKRGWAPPKGNVPLKVKVINMIRTWPKMKKRRIGDHEEDWMKVPNTFPLISLGDIFNEPIIVKARVEDYLVRRIYVDEGVSVEISWWLSEEACRKIQDHSSKSSSSKLFPNVFPTLNKTNTSLLELELLFSPMYEVYFNEGNKGVSKSFALSDNLQQQDTQSTFNVRLTLELIIPPTDVNAKENNTDQAIDA